MQESASSPPSVDSLKVPPHSIEAEQSVLGGLMLSNEAWFSIADRLTEKDFYRRDHQLIFQAIKALSETGNPSDVITLSEWLGQQSKLELVGGLSYLGMLAKNTPSAANIVAYADIVRERSILRQLVRVGGEIASSAFQTNGRSTSELLDVAERQVFEIAEQGARNKNGFVPVRDLLAETLDRIDTLYQKEEAITGVPTGFTDFDNLTSGLQHSDLIIIAGRPSMGKCLSADSEILLADGRLATIESLYQQQHAELLTLNSHNKFSITQPSAFIDDGIKPVYRVTTRSGRTVESTLPHPFLTLEGWKPLASLQKGVRIAVPRLLNVFGTQALDLPTLDKLAKKCARKTKKIPEAIFQLPQTELAYFLKQLILNNEPENPLRYLSKHEHFVRQLQHLWLRFGILSHLGRYKKSYTLTIEDFYSVQCLIYKVWLAQPLPAELPLLQEQQLFAQVHSAYAAPELQPPSLANLLWQQANECEIYWDEIYSIQSVGNKQVYDLTIPDTHNFVANDICVHNTTFAMNIAENVALHTKLPVGIFSMEMSSDQLIMRVISSFSRINLQKVRTGKLEDDDWPRLTSAITVLSETPLFIDETPALNPTELRARARRLAREQGQLGLIVIDYLQLMQGSGNRENRAVEVSEISRSLKSLAKELNVPVIALSQLNRSLEQRPNKRPVMSDLRESGSIEQDADVIAFIYRDEVYNPDSEDKGTAEIIVAKQRNGPIDTVRLTFLGNITKFENHISHYGEG
jgi:replicative DNA helicase